MTIRLVQRVFPLHAFTRRWRRRRDVIGFCNSPIFLAFAILQWSTRRDAGRNDGQALSRRRANYPEAG